MFQNKFSFKDLARLAELKQTPVPVDPEKLFSDGNTLAILGKFRRYARRAGWSFNDSRLLVDYLLQHEYWVLLGILQEYVEFQEDEEEEVVWV
ncbi:MAG: hypothetical protein ABEK59_09285 [Halobacteria archaeon]